jgi:4-amino-4-deoxy-L-arabinose transferase-like glycosyltransferase
VKFQKVIQQHQRFVESPFLPLAIVLFCAIFLRLLLTLGSNGILWPDSFAYYRSAALMAKHLNFTWHEIYRTPLYPFFMSPFLAFGQTLDAGAAIIIAQRLLGIAAIALFYFFSRKVFGAGVAFYSALLFSIHTLQLYYETVVQTETLFVFLLSASLWQSTKLFDSPKVAEALRLGLLLGLMTLTRPLGQYTIPVFLVALAFKYPDRKTFSKLGASLIIASALVLLPWMYVNKITYKFFGISQDIGLNLFHRVIDIEGLEPVKESKYPRVNQIWNQVKHRAPSSYFSVYHQLRRERVSARKADIMLKTVALETLAEYPIHKFLWTSTKIFFRLFIDARNSVHFCGSDTGPYLCVPSTRGQKAKAFSNDARDLSPFAQRLIRQWFAVSALPFWLISPLAVCGAALLFLRRKFSDPNLLVCLGLVAVLSAMAAIINVPEDRFRLPFDPILFAFASSFVAFCISAFLKRARHVET